VKKNRFLKEAQEPTSNRILSTEQVKLNNDLFTAVKKMPNDPNEVRAILRQGADPNAVDSDGNSPLFYLNREETTSINVLLTYGANPNILSQDIMKNVPLYR
jgi:ankyrin repeat protein